MQWPSEKRTGLVQDWIEKLFFHSLLIVRESQMAYLEAKENKSFFLPSRAFLCVPLDFTGCLQIPQAYHRSERESRCDMWMRLEMTAVSEKLNSL